MPKSQCLLIGLLVCACESGASDDDGGGSTGESSSTGPVVTSTMGPGDSTGEAATDSSGSTAGADSTDAGSTSATDSAGSTDSTGSTDSSSGGDTDDGSTGSTDSGSSDDSTSTTGSDLSCVDVDAGSALGIAISGTVGGLGDDFHHECSGLSGEDLIASWVAPYTGVFRFRVMDNVIDSAIAVIQSDCNGTVLACNEVPFGFGAGGEPSEVTVALEDGEEVLVAATAPDGAQIDVVIEGEELSPDETCIDQDIGSVTGLAAASGTGPTIFLWTAPSTGTYSFWTQSGPNAIDIFRPGCATLSPVLIAGGSLTGPVPGPPSAFHALELVTGQTIALEIGDTGADFELNIELNATAGGTCCSPRYSAGCDVPGIEASVCANDSFCCNTRWDFNCSGMAKFAFDANCIED